MSRVIIALAVLGTILLPGATVAQTSTRALRVQVENPTKAERRDETVALGWADLRRQLPAITPVRVRVTDADGRREITAQAYDADADGQTDSLLFQVDLLPGETKWYRVEAVAPSVQPKARVHVKFVPERTDVAWESDRIAYRTYGQLLWQLENLHTSGVDVWMKRTRELVLDKWYSAGHDSYHVDRGEGADFFRVGSTMGGGATAIWRDGRLHRAENFAKHRIIADGPIRAAFELEFDPWDAAGLQVTETKRIAIDAGHNLYRQESVFGTGSGGPGEITYAVGFTKRKGLVGSMTRANSWAWLSGWGPVDRTTGGHGDLGTAVMLERANLVDWKETDDHYVAIATARAGIPVVHYIGAGWTPSGDFGSAEDWWAHLDAVAQRLAAPLRVTVAREETARQARSGR
ncbi:MAG: DUF4861 domain-containing protein [Gemmatimonadota bacterium]|nr:DUF4861 domain-containing protein [Gemmatimonadota bacterium]